jgi:two-component system CheB/CheR fusion protein
MEIQNRENVSIEDVLQSIFISRGFDIWDYNLSDLQNKISKRMSALNKLDLQEYAEYIASNPNEYKALFNTILGGESLFFRNPESWDFIRDSVLPKILQTVEDSPDKSIRIWSVGCSSGEEPYSLAIMLIKALKDSLSKYKIRIYATDIDEPSLTVASNGTYILDQLDEIPNGIKDNYFIHHGDLYTISPEIRRLLIFSKHNLVTDPPLANINLLLCRNVLMYLDPKLKPKIIQKLRYALNDNGYLWLGKGESHIDSNLYGLKPLNTEWRVFKKTPYQDYHKLSKISTFSQPTDKSEDQNNDIGQKQIAKGVIIIDRDYRVLLYNNYAHYLCLQRHLGQFTNDDLIISDDRWKHSVMIKTVQQISFVDLDICYQIVDLNSKIEHAINYNESMLIDDVEYVINENRRTKLKIEIFPIENSLVDCGAIIFLEDRASYYELQKKLKMTIESLEIANESLASANAVLKSTAEELEIINEYLQSKNSEELMTISEELAERTAEFDMLKLLYESMIKERHDK